MAKKKIPSIDDALKIFKDAMQRASLSDYLYVDKTLHCKHPKDYTVLVIPDQALWLKILEDDELKDQLKEINITDPNQEEKIKNMRYVENLEDDGWIDIDSEILFKGKIFKVSSMGFDYEIPVSRALLPLKLKKAEYNNIKYRIFTSPDLILSIKKKFEFPAIPNCGFCMIRLFKII